MAKRIAVSSLNASTIDILNVIRQNASFEYQQNVPVIKKESDIPTVGEVIYGNPSLSNQFINALVNRIALVAVKSANFNNPYSILKKGYLEFGETIEEIFVNITKVVDYSSEKGESREFKRNLPDVRSAFHVINYKVMYPVTIEDEALKQAFLSIDGVQNLIAKIVDSVYTASYYDEFLLFKYLLIKSITKGSFYPISINSENKNDSAVKFRGTSNKLTFMSSEYNSYGVKTATPKKNQIIFMDAEFNAEYDVDILSAAFNMEKADFMGRLFLIDKWNTFDNDRFSIIRSNSTGLEEVTTEELAIMNDVKAVLVDEEFFQIYDNKNQFTEKYVASGLYWNYFYHVWKTVSYSPFANAVVFVSKNATITLPDTITVEIADKSISEEATVLSVIPQIDVATVKPHSINFVQGIGETKAGIAVQKYGALLIPKSAVETNITLSATINGTVYKATTTINASNNVGDTVTLNKEQ